MQRVKKENPFLNLDNIASRKDTRTTIMIRNNPIKYTNENINETFRDFLENMIVYICLSIMKKLETGDMLL